MSPAAPSPPCSISASARTRKARGITEPRVRAVRKLIANSLLGHRRHAQRGAPMVVASAAPNTGSALGREVHGSCDGVAAMQDERAECCLVRHLKPEA